MDTQNKLQPVARSQAAKFGHRVICGIERWKQGLAVMLLLFIVAASSALLAGIPLAILADLLDVPSLTHWKNVALVSVLTTLPYLVTSPGFSEGLRDLLDPKLRK